MSQRTPFYPPVSSSDTVTVTERLDRIQYQMNEFRNELRQFCDGLCQTIADTYKQLEEKIERRSQATIDNITKKFDFLQKAEGLSDNYEEVISNITDPPNTPRNYPDCVKPITSDNPLEPRSDNTITTDVTTGIRDNMINMVPQQSGKTPGEVKPVDDPFRRILPTTVIQQVKSPIKYCFYNNEIYVPTDFIQHIETQYKHWGAHNLLKEFLKGYLKSKLTSYFLKQPQFKKSDSTVLEN